VTAIEDERRDAGAAAAALVEPGMRVGLGTGATVAWFLRALGERRLTGLRCVATSPETATAASELGIPVEPFDHLDRLDIAVDGADQVAPDRWAVKGGHGAHLREKIVAAAADRFVVIVSSEKLVEKVHAPIPLELRPFGLPSTLNSLKHAQLRDAAPPSPDGGVVADYLGPVDDPGALAEELDAIPGLSGHGLFGPALVADVLVGGRFMTT
jgi:ribose 5-phosphate isomerase A